MTLKRLLTLVLFAALMAIVSGCGEYQQILKSQDYDLWYTKGLEYYEKGDYVRASNLLSPLITVSRGTERAETVMITYAYALHKSGDNMMGGHYFREFVKTFPGSERCEESQFMSGYCYYLMSPKPRLDQSDTEAAINEFQLFLNLYPNSERVDEAVRCMNEMRDKLVYKSYLNARLYFDLGNYMGNNYRSAVIAAQNSLKRFPDTQYREELSFLILEAKFIQAEHSVIEKKGERYRDTIDEYYAFQNEFPESKYSSKALSILETSQKSLRNLEKRGLLVEDKDNYNG